MFILCACLVFHAQASPHHRRHHPLASSHEDEERQNSEQTRSWRRSISPESAQRKPWTGRFVGSDLEFDEEHFNGIVDLDRDDDELDVDRLFMCEDVNYNYDDHMDAGESEPEDNSALLDVVLMLVKRMPSNGFARLIETWRVLSEFVLQEPVKVGSGCSGSGLDWHCIKIITEVFVE